MKKFDSITLKDIMNYAIACSGNAESICVMDACDLFGPDDDVEELFKKADEYSIKAFAAQLIATDFFFNGDIEKELEYRNRMVETESYDKYFSVKPDTDRDLPF